MPAGIGYGKKAKRLLGKTFGEVFRNPPAIVAKTRRKKGAGAARKQKVAIALSKARKASAKVPRK